MKSQVLHTVWCNIYGEAAGENWHWSLFGVKGISAVGYCVYSINRCPRISTAPESRKGRPWMSAAPMVRCLFESFTQKVSAVVVYLGSSVQVFSGNSCTVFQLDSHPQFHGQNNDNFALLFQPPSSWESYRRDLTRPNVRCTWWWSKWRRWQSALPRRWLMTLRWLETSPSPRSPMAWSTSRKVMYDGWGI